MLSTSIKNQPIIVVGNFYFYRGNYNHRSSFPTYAASDEIAKLFTQNDHCQESFELLAQHEDPRVRMLVARNLEQLEQLSANNTHGNVQSFATQQLGFRPRAMVVN